MKRLFGVLTLFAVLAVVSAATTDLSAAVVVEIEQPQPPSGFVPAEEIPPGEQIPAINLVAAAYGFVWIAVLAYVWSIAGRLKKVEGELAALEARKK